MRAHVFMSVLLHFVHVGYIFICHYASLRIPMPHTPTSFRPFQVVYMYLHAVRLAQSSQAATFPGSATAPGPGLPCGRHQPESFPRLTLQAPPLQKKCGGFLHALRTSVAPPALGPRCVECAQIGDPRLCWQCPSSIGPPPAAHCCAAL